LIAPPLQRKNMMYRVKPMGKMIMIAMKVTAGAVMTKEALLSRKRRIEKDVFAFGCIIPPSEIITYLLRK
jgi:hypothetical protein